MTTKPDTITLALHYLPELPDADLDVIVFFAAGDSTLGAWDGERWIAPCGFPLDQTVSTEQVVAWADTPSL